MKKLPINIDCGENYGRYHQFDESPIVSLAQLANVSCGFHGGDYAGIVTTLQLMKSHNVQVGAHPSFPDLQGFGRRYMNMEKNDLCACIFFQIASLQGLCTALDIEMKHVKAHGALYNACAEHEKEAQAFVEAIRKVSTDLTVLTMPDSTLEYIAQNEGLKVMRESFADRSYNSDLSLVSRQEADAVIIEPTLVKKQYEDLCNGQVYDREGNKHKLESDTVCIHGDHLKLNEINKILV